MAVKSHEKPVIVKLFPNVTNIASIAKACEDAGADGISLINTMLGMRIDLRTRRPVIANKMGGFSGPAIFRWAAHGLSGRGRSENPVVGMGGVSSAEDGGNDAGRRYRRRGGRCQSLNPYACRDIIRELPRRHGKIQN